MEVMKWVRRKWRSHLQFADDSLFIAKSTIQSVMCIKVILRWFEVVLGLKVMRIRGSDVCRSRECGGLGIKSVSPFNFALLGK